HSVCAAAWFGIAEHRVAAGGDPSDAIAHAEQRIDEALELNPAYSGDYFTRATLRMLQARVTRDPLLRARAMQRADADLTQVERNSGVWDAFARSEWCRLMASQSGADTATALRYLDRASAEIHRTEERLPYRDGRLWLERGRLERVRCRIAPTR